MKRSGRTLAVALLLSVLALAGATQTAGAANPRPPTVESLLGKEFESVSVKGGIPALKGKAITLRFFMHARQSDLPKQPTIGIGGGCNAWGSGYRIRKGRLASRGKYLGTAMLCKPDPDRWLLGKLRKGFKARTIGKRLVLTRPAEGVKLVFKLKRVIEEKPVPDEEPVPGGEPVTAEDLDGKSFESIKVTGQQVDKPIELSFWTGTTVGDGFGKQLEGSLLSAYLGCNWMTGAYEIEDGILTWSDTSRTPFWCQYDIDGWFHSLLIKTDHNIPPHGQGLEATLEGDLLTLTSPKGQIRGRIQIILKQVPSKS